MKRDREPPSPLLLGIDLGTSQAKAGLFNLTGELIGWGEADYDTMQVLPGQAEQSAEAWWQATIQAIRAAVQGVAPGRLAALCAGGQGPSVVLTDVTGRPVAPAVIWQDQRSQPQREALTRRLGRPVSPYAYLPKVLWMAQNWPEAWRQTRYALAAWDYLALRLTGRPVASEVIGSEPPFPADLVAASGLEADRFPPPIVGGTVIGPVTAAAAQATGLPVGLPVVAGVFDAMAGFIGAGLTVPGRAIDHGGTSGGFGLCWYERLSAEGCYPQPGPVPGTWIVGGPFAAAGRAIAWWQAIACETTDLDGLLDEATSIPPGAEGCVFLPYLQGERTPIWDPNARGVFFGLTLRHQRPHLTRAIIEGVAFALRHTADQLRAAGGEVREVRAGGGQAQHPLWNQVKADVLGVPVVVPAVRDITPLGVAILAGVGVGLLPDLAQAAAAMSRPGRIFTPDPAAHAAYARPYALYRALYPRLKGLMAAGE